MKKLICAVLILSALNVSADNWTQKASIPDSCLRAPSSFSIGTKGYVCGGGYWSNTWSKSLWEYDQLSNVWTQKADYGGGVIQGPTALVIQGKGYVGLGWNQMGSMSQKSWWQYDPNTNIWVQKADFGGGRRGASFPFSINNKGYVFGGIDSISNCLNDLWEYDATLDNWTQKTSCPCLGRFEGISFSINSEGYMGGGINSTGIYPTDFWAYNPITDNWTQKATIPINEFVDNGYFSIGNFGYITCGEALPILTNYLTNLLQYNSILDQWVTKASFAGAPRDEVASFSIGNYGYVGWGGANAIPQYNDFYEYTPDSSDMMGVTEMTDLQIATIYPSPFRTSTTIAFKEQQTNVTIKITDDLGREIKTINFTGKQLVLDGTEMKEGVYFMQVTDEKKKQRTHNIRFMK